MSFFRLNKVCTILAGAAAAAGCYVYNIETSPSFYEAAARNLNIHGGKQGALLKTFTMAGYFNKQKAWTDINRSKIFGESTESVFMTLYPVIHKSHADEQNPHKVNIDLLKTMFGRSKHYFWEKPDITTKQVEDWILYLAQNAFDRKVGQERSELNSHDWMATYKAEYFAAARMLGLTDRIDPDIQNYDEAWIAGASRPGVFARIIDYKWMLDHGVTVTGPAKVLAGARPLWAEIDGMDPDILKQRQDGIAKGIKIDDIPVVVSDRSGKAVIEDGESYIISLAAKLNIPLVPGKPLIKYATKVECPKGYFPGRTYPNYVDPDGPKLDESKMSDDMLQHVLGMNDFKIVDTKAQNNQRPNTETTARDAAEALVRDILDGKYGDLKTLNVLFESNQPYIERQVLSAQRAVDQVLKAKGLHGEVSVTLHGVGFGCKQGVATIHSELGALIAERWRDANPYSAEKHLMFQTRDNDSVVQPLGDVEGVD